MQTWQENLVDPQRWNRYAYVRNNPLRYKDPDGRIIETLWDAVNVGLGAASLVNNVREGNWGSAALDLAGTVYDGVAAAVPLLPGGASTAIKAARAGDKALDRADGLVKTSTSARGGNTVATQIGRERHKELAEKVLQKPGWQSQPSMRGGDGKTYFPDVVTPRGRIMELKPDTATGRARGARQTETYREQLQAPARVITYRRMSRKELTAFLDQALRPLGFHRHKGTWNRRLATFVDVISLQKDKSNDLITVNIGVAHRDVFKQCWATELPAIVTEVDCTARARIGQLIDNRDVWWPLEAPATAEEIRAAIVAYAMPFLEEMRSLEAMEKHLTALSKLPYPLPAILLSIVKSELGDRAGSCAVVIDTYRRSNASWRTRIRDVAERIGCGTLLAQADGARVN